MAAISCLRIFQLQHSVAYSSASAVCSMLYKPLTQWSQPLTCIDCSRAASRGIACVAYTLITFPFNTQVILTVDCL